MNEVNAKAGTTHARLLSFGAATAIVVALLGTYGFGLKGDARPSGPVASFTFVHATDPHLFEDPSKKTQSLEEFTNRKAFAAALETVRRNPLVSRPQVLVLTGDLGLDETWLASSHNTRAVQFDTLTALFKAHPVPLVLFVAGNKDIAHESAAPGAEAKVAQFIDSLQDRLRNLAVPTTIRDLTSCFGSAEPDDTGCIADIPSTDIRFIGFPSYSFKNASAGDVAANDSLQRAAVRRLGSMVDAAEKARRRVIILMHEPDLADPLSVAHDSANKPLVSDPSERNPLNWNVSTPVLDGWARVVRRKVVVGVLAGHLHDVQRAVYVRPYAWSPRTPRLGDPVKTFVAPPLAIKRQLATPMPARGVAVITLGNSGIERQLLWFDRARDAFVPDAACRCGDRR